MLKHCKVYIYTWLLHRVVLAIFYLHCYNTEIVLSFSYLEWRHKMSSHFLSALLWEKKKKNNGEKLQQKTQLQRYDRQTSKLNH